MILFINVTNLSRFEKLYKDNEDLQLMVNRWTGIKWEVNDESDKEDVEKILVENKIKYQWDG